LRQDARRNERTARQDGKARDQHGYTVGKARNESVPVGILTFGSVWAFMASLSPISL